MRTPLLSRSLLFLAFALATLAPVGHAAVSTIYYPSGPAGTIAPPTGYVGFEIPVERAGHAFTCGYTSTSSSSVPRLLGGPKVKVQGLVTDGSGGVRSLLVAGFYPTGVASWWIKDITANQESPHYPGAPIGMNSLLNVPSTLWTTTSGVPNRYFAIPDSRAAHGLIFGNPGGAWAAVATMNLIGTYTNGTNGTQVLLPWSTVFATAPASTSATDFLADRTTGEKALPGVGDVRAAEAWSSDPNAATYPLSWVQVQVEAREAGHAFTVHGTVPGVPEQLLRVTARAVGTGAVLGFALGTGTHFWVTRDAEDGATNQPSAPATGFWTASPAATFSALLIFPDPPGRPSALVWHTFYVNARTRPDHQFSVRMSDGYTSTFGPVAIGAVSRYEQTTHWGYLSDSTPNPVPIYCFSVLVDPTVMLTLLDTTNGTQLGVSPASNPTTWYDGWDFMLNIPVPDPGATPAITLRLPSAHVMDYFRLRRRAPDGWSSYLGATAFGSSRTFLSLTIGGSTSQTGLDYMDMYYLEHSTAGFSHPLPAEPGPFLVENMTTLQARDGIFAGLNDLTEWFEPPKPLALQISSSRQGHRLVVRHPNGEFFPIQNGNVAGSTSTPATGPSSWYQNYYYFDASAVARSELPWYVEDVDTGERLGSAIPLPGPTTGSTVSFSSSTTAKVMPINPLAGPSNSDLINWIAVPTPGPLTGASSATTGVISLQWPLSYLPSNQGGFEIERQLGSQGWLLCGNLDAAAADGDGFLHFSDPSPVVGYVHSYRVRYTFGAGAARRRSAPSNTVALAGWLDSDSDGLPDWWEIAHGWIPTNGALITGGDGDFDHDGVTNYEEYTYGTDPNNPGSMPFKVVRSLPETYQYSPQYGYAPNGAIVVYLDKPLPASVSSLPASFVQYSSGAGANWEAVPGTTLILPGRKAVAFLPAANLQPRPAGVGTCNYRIEFTTATTGLGAATATGTEALIPFHAPFSVREDSDTIGAWVRQTWPGYNHISVARTFAPVVEWSEPLLPASVVPSNVTLRAEGGTADLPVTVGFDYAANHLTITPAAALAADTLYTVTLLNPTATGLRNLLGTPLFSPYTWSFRTRPDPVPPVVGEGPYVTDTVPAAYAGNVQPGAAVQITFSEAMDETTLTTATVHLRAARESTDVPVTTSYDSGMRCLTLSLEVDLAYSTHYDIVLDAAALLSSAATPQALQAQATFSFVTAADPGSGGGGGGGGGPGGGGPGGEKKPDAPEPLTLAFRYGDLDENDAGGSALVEITHADGSKQSVQLPNAANGTRDYQFPNIPPDSTIRVTPQFSRGSDPDEMEEKDEVGVKVRLDPASANAGSKYLVLRQSGSSSDYEYLGPLNGRPYTAMFQPKPPAAPATQTLQLVPVDLAVDSDNNDGLNPPRRDGAEDAKEDYESAQKPANENPGKYIKLSTGDFDNDDTPDYADGMDIYNGFGDDKCGKFVPMIADLSGIKSFTGSKVKFAYTEANPANVTKETVPNDLPRWSPGTGDLRLWKKNGNEGRKTADIKNNGDFVKANTEYTVAELVPDSQGLLTLYVEAVRKSAAAADRSITMLIKLSEQGDWIEADKVRFTAIPRVLYGSPYDEITPLAGSKIKPAFEDGTDAEGQELGGLVSGSNEDSLLIGHYGPHPNAENDEAKDRQRLVVRLQTGTDTFTKGEDGIVLLVADGLAEGTATSTAAATQATAPQAQTSNDPPEVNGPEDWEAQFERILFEKYEDAEPRIEDLERDGFELWGWLYGGRSWEWFSGRDVWRDGSKIFVEDSLTPEQAADAYYGFLKRALPTEAQGVNLTPILRYYAELYEDVGENRAKVGQHMAKHWELVETTAGMLESEYIFVPASFALGGVLQIRRVNNMTFYTEGKVFAVPLIRRNWARGNITEHDTLVNSLGFSRNAGQNAVKVTGNVNGQAVDCIPDSIRSQWYIEVKDWKSLPATRQIRAEFSAAAAQSPPKSLCIIITGRTKRLSQPLMQLIEQEGGILLRRNVNADLYEFWNFQTGAWEAVDKATVIQWLP